MNGYEAACWERAGYRHPGGDEGIKRLAELERRYRTCEEGYFLNLCCGDGTGMEFFQTYGSRRYGLDCSEKLLAQAEKVFPECCFVCSDAENGLPFPEEWAAAVLCECSLSLFGGRSVDILKEIHRILKTGGLLLLADMTWRDTEAPEGFLCLEREEHPEWIREFAAAWLWENGELPVCGGGLEENTGGLPGYFLGVYRRCE